MVRKLLVFITFLLIAEMGFVDGGDLHHSTSGCCEEINLPEFCYCECYGQFFVGAELLYLRAFEGGLSDACDSKQIIDTTVSGVTISSLNGNAKDPDFDWNVGFRLGAGYDFANSSCNIGVYWTRFNSNTNGESGINEQNWKIIFNVVDVLYRCECDWSNCFILTPFGGIRYANIDQKLHSNFLSTTEGSSIISTGKFKEEFSGTGPLVGLEGDWSLGCGFSLYGTLSAAILYGTFHVNSNQTDEFTTGININHLRKNIEACQPVVDAGFGLRWKTCFCKDRLLIMQLGLEEHRYFNHNQIGSYGDLSLDGISLGLSLHY